MRKRGIVVLALLIAMVCAAAGVLAETKNEQPVRVFIKTTEPRSVAVIKHKGPFTDLPTLMTKLMTEVESGGHMVCGAPMAMFVTPPETTAPKDLIWQVMVPVVNPAVMGKIEFDKLGFQFQDAITVTYIYHVGPYEKVNDTYKVLFDHAKRNQYVIKGYPLEVYWSDPARISKEKLVTEVQVPIEEKKIPGIVR
jgi:effector-binding domain-containing protein